MKFQMTNRKKEIQFRGENCIIWRRYYQICINESKELKIG